MKKVLMGIIVLVILVTIMLFTYNYLLSEKLVEEFLQDLREGASFLEHPQHELLKELVELEITRELYVVSTKKGLKGTSAIIGLKKGEFEFTFTVERSVTDTSKTMNVHGIDIVNGIMIQKDENEENYLYVFKIDDNEVGLPSPHDFEIESGEVKRLVVIDGKIAALSPLNLVTIDKVMFFDGQSITGEKKGKFVFSKDKMRYGVEDGLYIGQKDIDLYLRNNIVVALVTREKFVPDTIRVLINDTGFKKIYHEEIVVSSTGTITVSTIEDENIHVDKDTQIKVTVDGNSTKLTIGQDEYSYNGRVYLKSEERIYFESIKRGAALNLKPGYRGSFEIYASENKLYLVNEVALEQYLYGVVPSEMPVSFGLQALEIQSIAARTYAVNNIYSSRFRNYSAHVVDSVSSQVYNNTNEYQITNQAVDNTNGKIIKYQNKVIDAKFFSTSSGYTAKANEVWGFSDQFPGPEIPYLKSKAQGLMGRYSISNEQAFAAFIKDKSVVGFDSDSPFFRWEIKISEKQLRKSIEDNLSNRFNADPNSVLTLEGDVFKSLEISESPLGEIKELIIVKRGEGGNIMELEIVAKNGTYRILKEYNIRFTLRPICQENPVEIHRKDGSILSNYSILPSAFAYFDQKYEDNKLTDIIIYGGGNGHGAGMSQYGVQGMLKAGYTKEDIISHYYEDTNIFNLY